ncbi:MAG: ABC transporter permease [Paracoccaceae bacterium]
MTGSRAPDSSQWGDIWRQFRRHRGAMASGCLLGLIVFAILIGPFLWRIDPAFIESDSEKLLKSLNLPPSLEHPLGTDHLGRDMLARMMAGGKVSLAVALTAVTIAVGVGTSIGVTAGYFRSLDGPLMRMADVFLSLPVLPLLLVIGLYFRDPLAWFFGPKAGTFILVTTTIGLTSWMQTARIVRGQVLALKQQEFMLAAEAAGTLPSRMIARHILPNVLSPIVVVATLEVATAIVTESSLSFLGLGFPPDFPTWGRILFDGADYIERFPERVIWPGIAISLMVLTVNYIGDGLRDALDPRARQR